MASATAAPSPSMGWRQHWSVISRNPALLVWCLFILLTPVYVLPSGLPQPGDLLLLPLAPLALLRWDGRLDRESGRVLRALIRFFVLVCLVNFGWALVLWQIDNPKNFLLFPIYYLFNLIVFFAALVIAKREPERFLRITVWIVIATVLVQTAASFVFRADMFRGQVFFNSPNQLGYYALLSASLIAVSARRLQLGRYVAALSVTGCAYLAMLSASRAAMAGILVLLAAMLFSNPRTVLIASLAAIGLLTIGGPIKNAIDAAEYRTFQDKRTERIGFAKERGYDRMWEYPEYLVTGAGEGMLERFTKIGEHPHELHSSFATILFSYGVIGFVLFGAFLFRVFQGASVRDLLMLVPVLMYTLAHNGLRFTSFWVVLAAFTVLKRVPEPRRAPARISRPLGAVLGTPERSR